jgi:hypothetical protein
VIKAVHNAAFDVPRLDRHLGLRVSPVHDTCLAARRVGERGCSLKAQAERHLGLVLDKGARQSDWGGARSTRGNSPTRRCGGHAAALRAPDGARAAGRVPAAGLGCRGAGGAPPVGRAGRREQFPCVNSPYQPTPLRTRPGGDAADAAGGDRGAAVALRAGAAGGVGG